MRARAEASHSRMKMLILGGGDAVEGIATAAGLDLDCDHEAIEAHDQIDLPRARAHVAGEHPGAAALQESGGDGLAEGA
jgi:hypothetical protein